MIEKLTNCPSCGGILNEAGRCQFCGSKVYDFLTIDMPTEPFKWPNAKTYLRVKYGNKIVLAPVILNTVEKRYDCGYTDVSYLGKTETYEMIPRLQTIDLSFYLTGEMIEVDNVEEQ